jgi:hypothetical protein
MSRSSFGYFGGVPLELMAHIFQYLPQDPTLVSLLYSCTVAKPSLAPLLVTHPSSSKFLWLSFLLTLSQAEEAVNWQDDFCDRCASFGYLSLLQWGVYNNCILTDFVVGKAAGSGNLEVIQWLLDNGAEWTNDPLQAAAEAGHAHVLKWAKKKGMPPTMRHALSSGNLELVQRMHKKGVAVYNWEVSMLASKGHVHILQWLKEKDLVRDWDCQSYMLERGLSLETIGWLLANTSFVLDFHHLRRSGRDGNFQVLTYAHAQGHDLDMADILASGNPEIIKWAINSGIRPTGLWHSLPGDVELLRLLHRHGCKFEANTAFRIAAVGNLDSLEFIKSVGKSFDDSGMFLEAAISRFCDKTHFDLLFSTSEQYLLDFFPREKLPLRRDLREKKFKEFFETLDWLVAQNCRPSNQCLCMAALSGHIPIAEWVIKQGAPLTESATRFAIFSGNFEMLKYIRNLGCDFDARCYSAAAEIGSTEILNYLVESNCSKNPRDKPYLAAKHFRVVRWLHQHKFPIEMYSLQHWSRERKWSWVRWAIEKVGIRYSESTRQKLIDKAGVKISEWAKTLPSSDPGKGRSSGWW